MAKIKPGYGIVHKAIMCNPNISFGAKSLYSLLAAYTGSDADCYPSQDLMAKNMNVTDRAIRKWLDELIYFGVVIKSKKDIEISNVNKYEINIPDDWEYGLIIKKTIRNSGSSSKNSKRNSGSDTPGTVVPTTINNTINNNNFSNEKLDKQKRSIKNKQPDIIDELVSFWNTEMNGNLVILKKDRGSLYGIIKSQGIDRIKNAILAAKERNKKSSTTYTWNSIIYKASNIESLSSEYMCKSNVKIPQGISPEEYRQMQERYKKIGE